MHGHPIRQEDGATLAAVLRDPERLSTLTLRQWDRLVPQARQAGLLARIALMIERRAGLDAVPNGPRAHLEAAQVLAEKQRRDTLSEVERLAAALRNVVDRIVLLKGAAYVCADLPAASGRIFSDIDILVPKNSLSAVEAVLGLSGWRLGDMDPYDEQYYRRWMHQLPPLAHIARQSVIDVHHTIVPTTARIDLRADALFAQAVDIPGAECLATLAPVDMVLHSATHLFNEGEFGRALRDLDDINQLLRYFGTDSGFWDQLTGRAAELDLERPLYYALRYATAILGTPVPDAATATLDRAAPSPPMRALMDALFERALRSPHPDCWDGLSRPALWLLYVRAHYLRMPLHLLLPHLLRKAVHPARDGALQA